MTLLLPSQTLSQASPETFGEAFVVSSGSIPGREHLRLHKNNQDGLAVRVRPGRVVCVVTDGCGSGRCSEVGAKLGARFVAGWLDSKLASGDLAAEDLARELEAALLGHLLTVGSSLGADLAPTVADYFLFTVLACVLDARRIIVVAAGDGVVALDDRRIVLDPGEANAPLYPAYRLLAPNRLARHRPIERTFEVLVDEPTGGVSGVMLATDGVIDAGPPLLDELLRDPRYEKNPWSLQRRLVVLGERERTLSDDTTIALIRRRRS